MDATAIAAQALFAAGEDEAAEAAVEWLEGEAQSDGPERTFWQSTACGAPAPSRATTQGVLGLLGISYPALAEPPL